jgi:drug/metabolite transporter (DMT)-like permease
MIGLLILSGYFVDITGDGQVLVSHNNSSNKDSSSKGDMLLLGAACSWSLHLFRLSRLATSHQDEIQLQAWKTLILACCDSTWYWITYIHSGFQQQWPDCWDSKSAMAWTLMLYSAAGPGMVGDLLHQKAQMRIAASQAVIILSLEPLFSAVCAAFLLKEVPHPNDILGGCMILAAALSASL